MKKKVGFIGLGKMGLPMALNLCKAGYELVVCSSRQESQNKILEAGGQYVDSFQKMASICDILITIVPADKEIISLYKGEQGLLTHARKNLVCIDMTSAKGTTKQGIANYISERKLEVEFLDAPVSGGVSGAESGTLTVMVGSTETQFKENLELLQAMGSNVIHTGPVGSSSNIKMLNQMLNGANAAIAAEVLCMSRKLGVADEILCQVVNQSSGRSFVFEKNVPKYMMTGDHTPGFKLKLMKKDLGLFVDTAQEIDGFTPLADMIYQIYRATENQGHGEDNYTYIHKWFEANQNHDEWIG